MLIYQSVIPINHNCSSHHQPEDFSPWMSDQTSCLETIVEAVPLFRQPDLGINHESPFQALSTSIDGD